MNCTFVPCLNNSLLIPLNPRLALKNRRISSVPKLEKKTFLILPPSPKIIKPSSCAKSTSTIPPHSTFPLPTKSLRDSVFDIDLNLNDLGSEDLRPILSKIIRQEIDTLNLLKKRCRILEEMINSIPRSSDFGEKEVYGIIKLINQMGHTVANTSEIEIELGVRNRLYEKKILEAAVVKRNNDLLHKKAMQYENEMKELKAKIKILQDENIKQIKINDQEKQRYSEMQSKVHTLEESLWVLANSASIATQDSVVKLKGAIGALMRDATEYKKEIQGM